MTDLEKMQAELSDDLMGNNGQDKQTQAILDMADLMIGSAFSQILIKGGGDLGVKQLGSGDMVVGPL